MPARRYDLVQLVSRRIADVRAASGLTQEALATRLDIATKNVQRLESGRQNLTLKTIERVADALRVDRETLLGAVVAKSGEENAPPSALATLVDAGFVVVPASQKRQRPEHAVPVVDLLAAAGSFHGEPRTVGVTGWTVLRRRGAPPAGQFVAQVRGASMAPRIPDGSVCLFGPARAPLEGRVVLLEHDAVVDSDLGGAYAVKRIAKIERPRDGRVRVVLGSFNPRYAPVVVSVAGDGELRVIAEFVEVLAPG